MSDLPTVPQFRSRFPALADTVHLASCSQGALSDSLSSGLFEFQHTIRQHGAPWDLWMVRVAEARAAFARLINADVDEIAVVPSASEGAYQVASTQDWLSRPGLVTTDLEFPSVAHVWLAQEPRGAEVRYVEHHDGIVDAEDYEKSIDDRTGLVSVPLISYANGLRFPVADVVRQAHGRGAHAFVDAYQGLGVEPVDVRELECEYLVCGALKYLLGVSGIAFLYVRADVRDAIPPAMTGWFGRVDPFEFDPRNLDHPEHARRFETGTPSIPAAYGAVAGLSLLGDLDAHLVRDHVRDLTRSLQDQLLAAGELVGSPTDDSRRGPMVALRDQDPNALGAFLKQRRIVASPRGELVRMSFHYYNDDSDIDAVLHAVSDHRAGH